MGVYAGPEINESGLVLSLDAGNPKSYPSTPAPVALTGVGNTPANLFDNNVTTTTASGANESLTWTGNINLGTGKYYLILSAWGVFSQGPVSGVTLTVGGVDYTTAWGTIRGNTDFLGQTIGQGGTFSSFADGRRSNLTPLGSGTLTSIVSSTTGGGFPNIFYAIVFVPDGVSDTDFANHVVVTNSLAYPTTWTDLSGRGNTGTLTNGPIYSSANGGSIVFDGTNDYVSPTGLTDAFWQGNWTASFWVNFDTNSNTDDGTSDKTLLQHGISFTRSGLHLTQRNTRIFLGLFSDDLSGNAILTTGTWYNFVFTLNNTTRVKQIYMNGNLDASDTGAGAYVGTGNNSIIGGPSLTFGSHFDGFMPSCSFYNRVLSAAEVSQNFIALRNRFGI